MKFSSEFSSKIFILRSIDIKEVSKLTDYLCYQSIYEILLTKFSIVFRLDFNND